MMTFNLNHFIPDLSQRAVTLELMDDAKGDESMLFTTLRDFKYINRFLSQIRRVLHKTVFADMRRRGAREVSFLDVAAGGCDTAVWFTRQCRRLRIKCLVYCLDNNPRILRYARNACRCEPSIIFIQADARDIGALNLSVDYAFTNHFLHHLPDSDIPPMLRAIHDCCKRGFVAHDIERLLAWYFGYSFIGRMFWREGFTRQDGCLSIRRGFRRAELEGYIERANINGTISRSGLGHWLITNIHT